MTSATVRLVGSFFTAALTLWPLQPVVADDTAGKTARLVKQLGSDDYAEREAASSALDKLGEAALPLLRAATRNEDAEVRRRASELVRGIENGSAERARAPFLALVAEVGGRAKLEWDETGRVTASVNLAGTPTTDVDLRRLAAWAEIRTLDLSRTNVTDADLTHLRGVAGLRRLDLGGSRVTDRGVEDLQKAMPNASVSNSEIVLTNLRVFRAAVEEQPEVPFNGGNWALTLTLTDATSFTSAGSPLHLLARYLSR
jgi:hypothetical protein